MCLGAGTYGTRGQSCFLISTVFWGDGDRVFHCSRTHQVVVKIGRCGKPRDPSAWLAFPCVEVAPRQALYSVGSED